MKTVLRNILVKDLGTVVLTGLKGGASGHTHGSGGLPFRKKRFGVLDGLERLLSVGTLSAALFREGTFLGVFY